MVDSLSLMVSVVQRILQQYSLLIAQLRRVWEIHVEMSLAFVAALDGLHFIGVGRKSLKESHVADCFP